MNTLILCKYFDFLNFKLQVTCISNICVSLNGEVLSILVLYKVTHLQYMYTYTMYISLLSFSLSPLSPFPFSLVYVHVHV